MPRLDLLQLVKIDLARIDAETLMQRHILPHRRLVFRTGQDQHARLLELHIPAADLVGPVAEDTETVARHRRREIVRIVLADDRAALPRRAGANVVAFDNNNIAELLLRQPKADAQPDDAAPDDHDIGGSTTHPALLAVAEIVATSLRVYAVSNAR